MKYRIVVYLTNDANGNDSSDGYDEIRLTGYLPFVPFVGLTIRAKPDNHEFHITEVGWQLEGFFKVYSSQSESVAHTAGIIKSFKKFGWKGVVLQTYGARKKKPKAK
jgi:hypothetical protein